MTTIVRLALGALLYLLLFTSASTAHAAGRYIVTHCGFRDGDLAPTPGWQVARQSPGANYDLSCNDRDRSMGVTINNTQTYPDGYWTGIQVNVPADLVVTRFDTRYRYWADGGGPYRWLMSAGFWTDSVAYGWTPMRLCSGPDVCVGQVHDWWPVVQDFPMRSIALGVRCSGRADEACPRTAIGGNKVLGVEMTVEDAHPPELIGGLGGPLLAQATTQGPRELTYVAHDRGSGMRAVLLEVDGVVVERRTVQSVSGSCRTPYTSFRPCPPKAQGSFVVDTTQLSPGVHRGRLLLHDASDSPPTVAPFAFVVPGPPTHIGSCAPSEVIRAQVNEAPVAYGSRRLRFSLRSRRDLPSTAIVMEDEGGHLRPIARATRRNGVYVAAIRSVLPRVVRLTLPLDGSVVHACSERVAVAVRAGLRLAIRPRKLANGDVMRLRGRLLGRQHGHQLVEIHARAREGRRAWISVKVLRTDRSGRFRMRYRFRRTTERVTFEFRALRRAAVRYPFASGASRVVRVIVTG